MESLKEAMEQAKTEGTYEEKDENGLPKWLSGMMRAVPLPPSKFILENKCELTINPTNSKPYTFRILVVRKVLLRGHNLFLSCCLIDFFFSSRHG